MASFKLTQKAHCQEVSQGVCPVRHTKQEGSSAADGENRPSVDVTNQQDTQVAPAAAVPVGVCPVHHGNGPKPSALSTNEGVCPVRAGAGNAGMGLSSLASAASKRSSAEIVTAGTHGSFEPRDTDQERYVAPYDPEKAKAAEEEAQGSFKGIHNAHVIPGGRIPATGRGNSSDGADWVNPTPAELFRALRRKNKPIEEEDAWSVAFVHSVVVDQTWAQILEYEELHKDECAEPTLHSFEGKYGQDSVKTKLFNIFYPQMVPFDRHDWYVDRCGKRIRYIIDYYATEEPDGSQTYAIDARPEPTFGGIRDRMIVACKRWWRGDSVW